MTKRDELAALDGLIRTLGPDSYLGPWLLDLRPEIERDLTCDLQPTYLGPHAMTREARAIREAAIAEGKEIRIKAEAEALKTLARARADVATLKERASAELRRHADMI